MNAHVHTDFVVKVVKVKMHFNKDELVLSSGCFYRAVLIDWCKTKTKVIFVTNHNRRRPFIERIITRSKSVLLEPSAGKPLRASQDWFWFYF